MKIFLVLTLTFAAASVYGGLTDGVVDQAVKFLEGCGSSDLSLCFKERALRMVDNLPADLEIAEGIHLKENEAGRQAKQYNNPALPEEPRARELAVDDALLNKAFDFMSTHTVEIKMPKDSMDDIKRSLEESRSSKKKTKKLLMPLLLLFKLKAATLIPLALGTIALIAFKALAIGKLALIISAVIGIKKLLDDKHQSSTYEVHPHFDEHGRSFSEDAQKLAYRGQL